MVNPYAKSHQAGQHQAWLEGLRAGTELAQEEAAAVEGCRCGCQQGAWLDWGNLEQRVTEEENR